MTFSIDLAVRQNGIRLATTPRNGNMTTESEAEAAEHQTFGVLSWDTRMSLRSTRSAWTSWWIWFLIGCIIHEQLELKLFFGIFIKLLRDVVLGRGNSREEDGAPIGSNMKVLTNEVKDYYLHRHLLQIICLLVTTPSRIASATPPKGSSLERVLRHKLLLRILRNWRRLHCSRRRNLFLKISTPQLYRRIGMIPHNLLPCKFVGRLHTSITPSYSNWQFVGNRFQNQVGHFAWLPYICLTAASTMNFAMLWCFDVCSSAQDKSEKAGIH